MFPLRLAGESKYRVRFWMDTVRLIDYKHILEISVNCERQWFIHRIVDEDFYDWIDCEKLL